MTHKTTSTTYNQTKQTDKIWKKNNQQPFFCRWKCKKHETKQTK